MFCRTSVGIKSVDVIGVAPTLKGEPGRTKVASGRLNNGVSVMVKGGGQNGTVRYDLAHADSMTLT